MKQVDRIDPVDDLKTIEAAQPFIRSILAFCLFLRRNPAGTFEDSAMDASYKTADKFIDRLKKDLNS